MELGLATSAPVGIARRTAPIVGGCALAATAALVATNNPGAAGSRYPACVFRQMTGLWCPGCGLTRGTYELLHGHIGSALSYNLFTPLALVAIIAVWVVWLRTSWGAQPMHVPARTGRVLAIILPTSLIVYGVLRNIPAHALQALAP